MFSVGDKLTVYLAGPMSSDPNYREKFAAAENELRDLGLVVLNPAWLPPEGFTYDAYLRMSGAMLRECKIVCLMPGWQDSPGALQENRLARKLGISAVLYTEDRVQLGALLGKGVEVIEK